MQGSRISLKWVSIVIFFSMLLISRLCCAEVVVIQGKKYIDKPTKYSNVTLDLHNGYFVVTNNATLDIENSQIIGVISSTNPSFVDLTNGNLILNNNIISVQAQNILPRPGANPLFKMLDIEQGQVTITNNTVNIDMPYTVAFLITGSTPTAGFIIKNNKLKNFHGGIMLNYSNNALVSGNELSNISVTNLMSNGGENNKFIGNTILFSGNNSVGNGVDIFSSNNVTLDNNYIADGSCYSVTILRSKNIMISNNSIVSGITYAIFIDSTPIYDMQSQNFIPIVKSNNPADQGYENSNITITNNYFAQNRYGLAAINVDKLVVTENYFIQKFKTSSDRKFWTDNKILLTNVTNLTWSNNTYKEAFVQNLSENNNNGLKYTQFPIKGGVSL